MSVEDGSDEQTGERPDVVRCADGPMLVRGRAVVTTEDGVEHPTVRPVSAVCRCGATSRAPWCDGAHKLLNRRRTA